MELSREQKVVEFSVYAFTESAKEKLRRTIMAVKRVFNLPDK